MTRRTPALDALFLDRDGTLIVERGFLADPRGVRLSPGAAPRLAALEGAKVFVVTNQSGLARGLLTWPQVEAVNAEVGRRLSRYRVQVEEFLVCPHYPRGSVPELTKKCRCRKPGTLLHERALRAHGLDPRRCAAIGDKVEDVAAGLSLGMRAVHVLSGHGREHRARVVAGHPKALLAPTLAAALDLLTA